MAPQIHNVASHPQPAQADPLSWLDVYGDVLFRYAVTRVRDKTVAEDLVQETFLAALMSRSRFEERSSEQTWMLAILRRKIADWHRQRMRRQVPEMTSDDPIEGLFDSAGAWVHRPGDWSIEPEELVAKSEFWQVFSSCLKKLPERQGAAFSLRVLDELTAEETCKSLSLSPTNLWVTLHRARARLRECLERFWFQRHPQKPV